MREYKNTSNLKEKIKLILHEVYTWVDNVHTTADTLSHKIPSIRSCWQRKHCSPPKFIDYGNDY